MKNGISFIVVELFMHNLLEDVTMWKKSDVKSQKMEHLWSLFQYIRTEPLNSCFTCHMLCPPWHFHGNTMGSTSSPFKGKNQSFSPSRSVIIYLLLLFIPWVSVNMDITRQKQKIVCYTLDQQLRHFSFWESRGLVPSMLLWWHQVSYDHRSYERNLSNCV